MEKLTIQSIENLSALDYWQDSNNVHRRYIENHLCKCGNKLCYEGYANLENYFAFGICQKCKYARLFEHLSDIKKMVDFDIKKRAVKAA